MDYLNYGVEDFLCDTSFQRYCIGNHEQSVNFWTDWIAKNPEKEHEFNTAKKIYFELNGAISAQDFDEDYKFFKNAFYQHIVSSQTEDILRPDNVINIKSNRVKFIVAVSSIAATIIIALLFYFQINKISPQKVTSITTYVTPKGQKRTLTLPDGSQISLNGGTKIIISPGYNRINRDVDLTGEAFFQVSHNTKLPFIVHTAKFNVRVLGTIFNIRAYNSDKFYETSLLKGSVRIRINDGKHETVTLTPHQKFVYSGIIANTPRPTFHVESIDKQTVSPSIAETDWTRNRLTFDDERLEDIATTLERWYGIDIIIKTPAFKDYRYTSTFENDDILHVLNILQLTNHFNYRKEGNLIIIY